MDASQLPLNGTTQQQILVLLLDKKDGLTVDQFVDHFGIGRTAVNQHLSYLQRDGYVAVGRHKRTGGRPSKVYVLTDDGVNLFPKKYSWFSGLLLQALQDEIGAERVGQYLRRLGVQKGREAMDRVAGKRLAERVYDVVGIMNETGFDAKVIASQGDDTIPRIECKNCVYHNLARDYPAVCQFDLGILSTLMETEVEHQDCMVRGGSACRFRFVQPTKPMAAPGRAATRKNAATKARNSKH